MPAGRLRHVDPHKRRGVIYRTFARLAATRPMGWLSRKVVWKLDPHVFRLSGGRFGLGFPLPTALLETRGARSGQLRRNGVIYFHDGDDVTIIASKLGMPEHPSWFYNVRAHPDVRLSGHRYHAQVVEDAAERERLWGLADRVFPGYAVYRERAHDAGRAIPIIRLTPR
jgi:deazaflavin-dependent oxidoreductase (nitroreductase family)